MRQPIHASFWTSGSADRSLVGDHIFGYGRRAMIRTEAMGAAARLTARTAMHGGDLRSRQTASDARVRLQDAGSAATGRSNSPSTYFSSPRSTTAVDARPGSLPARSSPALTTPPSPYTMAAPAPRVIRQEPDSVTRCACRPHGHSSASSLPAVRRACGVTGSQRAMLFRPVAFASASWLSVPGGLGGRTRLKLKSTLCICTKARSGRAGVPRNSPEQQQWPLLPLVADAFRLWLKPSYARVSQRNNHVVAAAMQRPHQARQPYRRQQPPWALLNLFNARALSAPASNLIHRFFFRCSPRPASLIQEIPNRASSWQYLPSRAHLRYRIAAISP